MYVYYMIVMIGNSTKKNKRYQITLGDGRRFDFGLKDGLTYIDHHDTNKRANYWKRHLGNKQEYNLIINLIPSPALFSAFILWGQSTSIRKNVSILNKLLRQKSKK